MDENHAIKLCLSYQDPRGFEFLVRQYRREAFFHAISLLGNQEDAEDACQECFSKAFRAIPRLKKLDKFYPWFYRILRNHCLNLIYRRKTSAEYRQKESRRTDVNIDHRDPAFLLEKDEERLLVWRALDRLEPEAREILVMKYIEGRSYDVISSILDIPRGTVMSRLYYARKAFREAYLEFDEAKEEVQS